MTKIDTIERRQRATLPRHARVRVGKREVTDPAEAWAVIDAARIAHVGFVADERPMVIPMLHARLGRKLYIHGAKATRIVKGVEERAPVCLTVTLLDGIVVARSAFHHSMNYRSVVVHAQARHVVNAAEKEAALVALTNRLLPGRWDEVRPMTAKEFGATGVLALDVEQITMKRRDGPPVDDEEDYPCRSGPVWSRSPKPSPELPRTRNWRKMFPHLHPLSGPPRAPADRHTGRSVSCGPGSVSPWSNSDG